MAQIEERLGDRVLRLRYDARGRLTAASISGMQTPWLELDPSVPKGEVHWSHFADKSVWRDGIHYESSGGPWESERETRKPYEQFASEELEAMRVRFAASVEAVSLPRMRQVFAYVRKHRLISRRCHISSPELRALVRRYGGRIKGEELAAFRAALLAMDVS